MERALLVAVRTSLALVLLTPLIVNAGVLPDTYFPFIVGKALYYRTLTEIAFGLWVVLVLAFPRRRAPASPLLMIFGTYALVVLLSSFFGVSLQRSMWSTYERMQGFVDVAHWFAFTVVLTSVFRTWADWRTLLNVNLAVSGALGLLGLAEQFEIWELNPQDDSDRLTITLGNPTYVGAYMMVNVLIGLGLFGHSLLRPRADESLPRSRRRRRPDRGRVPREAGGPAIRMALLWAGAIALAAIALFLTGATAAFVVLLGVVVAFMASYFLTEGRRREWWLVFWGSVVVLDAVVLYLSGTRGALLGLAAGLVSVGAGYAVWGRLRRVRIVAIGLVGSLMVLVLTLVLVRETAAFQSLARDQVMLARIANAGLDDRSVRGRFNTIKTGLKGFAEKPILGWGPENFTIVNDRYLTTEIVATTVVSFDQAHNKLVEELTTKGILGFAAYVAIWLYMLWTIVRRVRAEDSQGQVFTLFVGGALAGYFVQNLFLFDTPGTVTQFILLMGYVIYLGSSTLAAPTVESGTAGTPIRVLLKSDRARGIGLAVAGVLVTLTVFVFNYGPYVAARSVSLALSPQVSNWDERLELFQRSFSSFPPLANYPRIEMFTRIAANWGQMTVEEKRAAVIVADREGQVGIQAEPEDWRIRLTLARVYQLAVPFNDAFAEEAKVLVDRAAEVAPERIEVIQMQVMQRFSDGDFDGARGAISEYLEKNPAAESYFAGIRDQIDQFDPK